MSVRLEVRDRNLSETFLRRVPTRIAKSHFEGRADLADGDDDGLEAARQDRRSGCRRCREHGYIERGVDQEGHEAEESPSNKGAVRARGEDRSNVQGVQSLVRTVVGAVSARSAVGHAICEHGRRALSVQGVRWGINLRARSSAPSARSAVGQQSASTVVSALSARSAVGLESASTVVSALVQGVRWGINLRARSSALSVQGVRWVINLRARSSAL